VVVDNEMVKSGSNKSVPGLVAWSCCLERKCLLTGRLHAIHLGLRLEDTVPLGNGIYNINIMPEAGFLNFILLFHVLSFTSDRQRFF